MTWSLSNIENSNLTWWTTKTLEQSRLTSVEPSGMYNFFSGFYTEQNTEWTGNSEDAKMRPINTRRHWMTLMWFSHPTLLDEELVATHLKMSYRKCKANRLHTLIQNDVLDQTIYSYTKCSLVVLPSYVRRPGAFITLPEDNMPN